MLLPTTFKQLKKKDMIETCSLFQNPPEEKIITCTTMPLVTQFLINTGCLSVFSSH